MRGKRIDLGQKGHHRWTYRVIVISIAMLSPLMYSLTSHLLPLTSYLSLLTSKTNAQGVQTGKASYYAKKFSGRKTASGERLHHDSLTCAHRTYPFGTQLKVTNPANGKTVIVRVTDRGPYVKGRNPSIIPFKPEDIIDVPELELSTNEGPITKPIWVELKEQHMKKQASDE